MSRESKHNIKLIKELLDQKISSKDSCSNNSENNKTSKTKLIKKKLKLDLLNAKEFVPKIPSFKNIPKLKRKKISISQDDKKEVESNLKKELRLDDRCKKKAKKALNKLSPGKKALLQSIFMSRKKTTIKDLAEQLKEPEDKLEELKANALRSLIYGKS